MRILIVDKDGLFRAGFALLLKDRFRDAELLEANTVNDGFALAASGPLTIVFLDFELVVPYFGFNEPLSGYGSLAGRLQHAPIVVMAADKRRETICRCLTLGARGYFPKSEAVEVLHAAITAVTAGYVFVPVSCIDRLAGLAKPEELTTENFPGLSPRHLETLKWVLCGYTTAEIAAEMGEADLPLANQTVRKYVSELLTYFRARKRMELIVMFRDGGVAMGRREPGPMAFDLGTPVAEKSMPEMPARLVETLELLLREFTLFEIAKMGVEDVTGKIAELLAHFRVRDRQSLVTKMRPIFPLAKLGAWTLREKYGLLCGHQYAYTGLDDTVESMTEVESILAEDGRAPDVIITDSHLSDGSTGIEVADRIRQNFAWAGVIPVAFVMDEHKAEALHELEKFAGPFVLVDKAAVPNQLLNKVSRLVLRRPCVGYLPETEIRGELDGFMRDRRREFRLRIKARSR